MAHTYSRRDFLRVATMGVGATVLVACSVAPTEQPVVEIATAEITATPEPTPIPPPQPVLRIAHISDMHIEPSGPGREQFSRALRNLQSLNPSVDFVINAGDCVMDALFANKKRVEEQWDVFQSVFPADFPLPVYHAIGNHDVWGWGLRQSEQELYLADPLFAKGMMMQRLGMSSRYYSFAKNGWHFIVLDSVHPREVEESEHPYTGKLDDEQYDWLVKELEITDPATPICIVSHIPIFGACGLLDGNNESSGNWNMPGAWMHIDARRFVDLFWAHRNVKLCLSGHTHQVENLQYHGVKYLTNGAISGNWWKGPYHDFPPGYVLLNLYADGSSESEYVTY